MENFPLAQGTPGGDWRITGHRPVVEALARSMREPAHAYLFLGPERIGKTALALELAKALNCLGPEPPCQLCGECLLIEKSGHPDVTVLEPNEKDNLLIEQTRELRQALSLLPNQARRRVVILPADRLTESAADALLKTLEEPPAHVVLVLTGHELESVPETVVSRCRLVTMSFVDSEEIVTALVTRGVDADRARRLGDLAYGAPGWAFEAAEDEEMTARRESMREELTRWTSGTLLDRLAAAESLSGGGKLDRARATALEELQLLLTWWRDVLVTVSGQPELIVNQRHRETVERIASSETVAHTLEVVRAIGRAATRIDENVDPRLALEALAVGM